MLFLVFKIYHRHVLAYGSHLVFINLYFYQPGE